MWYVRAQKYWDGPNRAIASLVLCEQSNAHGLNVRLDTPDAYWESSLVGESMNFFARWAARLKNLGFPLFPASKAPAQRSNVRKGQALPWGGLGG